VQRELKNVIPYWMGFARADGIQAIGKLKSVLFSAAAEIVQGIARESHFPYIMVIIINMGVINIYIQYISEEVSFDQITSGIGQNEARGAGR
jgi:hypothetical protein